VQVQEGLVVAIAVEELAAPSPPVAAVVVGEERMVTEKPAPQEIMEPQAKAGSGGDDVVMVRVDQGAPLPPPTEERDVAALVAQKISAAGTASSIGGIEDMSMSRYLTTPGIGVIDLDATELPSNDREILEAVTDRVFDDLSLLVLGCHHVWASGVAPGRRCWWFRVLCRAGGGGGGPWGVCSRRGVDCERAPTPDYRSDR
jgi:hypothetical protein